MDNEKTTNSFKLHCQPLTVEEIIEALNLPRRMMTDEEVAEIKNCSVQTLRNNRHLSRGIPYHKDGRSIRYNPYDVALDILNSRIEPQTI